MGEELNHHCACDGLAPFYPIQFVSHARPGVIIPHAPCNKPGRIVLSLLNALTLEVTTDCHERARDHAADR